MVEDELRDIQPVVLAYIGDGVYELLCRNFVLHHGRRKIQQLHLETVELVKAEKQAKLLYKIMPALTEKELEIVRRGRNVKSHVPHHASPQEYRNATGFEALFGYLYLSGKEERINEIFSLLTTTG